MNNRFIISNNINIPGVKAIFTTRIDGDRKDSLKGFNLSSKENLSYLASFLGVSQDSLIFPIQRHTDNIGIITDTSIQSPMVADALITSMKGIVLGVLVADCVPILVYNHEEGIVAAIHAGWRGTASGIIKKTLKSMKEDFYSSLSNTIISIGPSIRGCCYEVDYDVLDAIKKETGDITGYSRIKEGRKYYVDLATANRIQAESLGISNIWVSEECTYCNPERFYSYRHYKGLTGRQGGFIGMI